MSTQDGRQPFAFQVCVVRLAEQGMQPNGEAIGVNAEEVFVKKRMQIFAQ